MSNHVHLAAIDATLQFARYQAGCIRVNQHSHTNPILCSQHELLIEKAPTIETLHAATIQTWVSNYQAELLIIGTGEHALEVPESIRQACQQQAIGLEVLSSDYAMKTLIALQQDWRSVIALLIP